MRGLGVFRCTWTCAFSAIALLAVLVHFGGYCRGDVVTNCAFEIWYDVIGPEVHIGHVSPVHHVDEATRGVFRVPETINGKPVGKLDMRCFSGQTWLESVEVPQGIDLSLRQFWGCTNLLSAFVSGSVGNGAFYNCRRLQKVTMGVGTHYIGSGAFANCINLTTVVLPEEMPQGQYNFGVNTFGNCRSLQEIIVPKGVSRIGEGAFGGGFSLRKVNLPDGVASIDRAAFHGCFELSEITFHDGLLEIGESAFGGCRSLVCVSFPSGLGKIGPLAFEGCTGLLWVLFEGDAPECGTGIFRGTGENLTVVVRQGSTGWGEDFNGRLPDKWQNRRIRYFKPKEDTYALRSEGPRKNDEE